MALLEMWDTWIVVAGAALALATVMAALVYMLGILLMNDKMKTWAKMELVEVVYSAIIISMAIGGLPVIDGVVQGSLGVSSLGCPGGSCPSMTMAYIPVIEGGTKTYKYWDICGPEIAADPDSVYHDIDSCHMRLGIWYLRELFEEAKTFAYDVYIDYIKTSMLAEFTINIEFVFEIAGFFTFTPWRGFFTMGNTVKGLAFDWALKLMMLNKFQEVLLRFIATALFPALFVMGAVMRTFTFTRRLGGLLLAMAITLYFLFPAFYAFGALLMIDIKNAVHDEWVSNTDINPKGADRPDPPIANTMYINYKDARNDFAMIGGSGVFRREEAYDSLDQFEAGGDQQFYSRMEGGDQCATISVDMSSDWASTASDAERDAALRSARESTDSWLENVRTESKYDHYVDHAWSPDGPLDSLARITFWSVFFSIFSLIGTIAAIRSLSMTFGGDIEIAGLTRLI